MVGWTDHLSFNRKSVRTRSLYDDGRETAEAICLFRKLGAFPVQKENLKSVKQALMTAKENMQAGGAVWLFHREIMHQDMRPLELEGGASFLVRQFEQVVVKPVTLHYTFNQFQNRQYLLCLVKIP